MLVGWKHLTNVFIIKTRARLLIEEDKNMKMSNKLYDVLKWIALCVLPSVATLYFVLSGIWGFPYGEQIVGTITAVETFVGALLGISNSNYKKNNKVE
jgi:hypothetical protein